MSHYETLGVPPTATAAELRRAYRKRARATHPDHGGDAEQFKAVNAAYECLRDPVRREQYDKFGAASERVTTLRQQAEAVLGGMAVQWKFSQGGWRDGNMVADLCAKVNEAKAGYGVAAQSADMEAREYRKVALRVTRKTPGDNVIAAALENAAQDAERKAQAARYEIEKGEEMLRVLADYEYKAERGSILDAVSYTPVRWKGMVMQ